ncbi:hypothetical protein ACFL9U_14460 [Thermodesulfobacteriota bacterium]
MSRTNWVRLGGIGIIALGLAIVYFMEDDFIYGIIPAPWLGWLITLFAGVPALLFPNSTFAKKMVYGVKSEVADQDDASRD